MAESKPSSITIATLQTLYANSLSSTLDGQLLNLEGFYFNKNGKIYGKHYYDDILSKDKNYKVTVQLTQTIKKQLNNGGYYQYQGFICKGQTLDNDSRLKVYFRITKIIKLEETIHFISKVEFDIIQARFDRDYPLINDILLEKIQDDRKPKLDIIIGVQSTSKEDYLAQLQDFQYYEIRHHMCNMSTKNEILNFIQSYDFKDTDLLIILRGGGSGLEVFNDIELCKKIMALPVPFITGIGHDEDKTLLEKVADKGFSTPTAVGVFLQKTINTQKERMKILKSKDDEFEKFKKQTDHEKNLLINQITSQKRTLNVVLILLLLLFIVFIGFLILKK
tara:strand:+ start:11366 stop:12370 length:1005 start_codon:yes stop_codon:yes gene_type:complete